MNYKLSPAQVRELLHEKLTSELGVAPGCASDEQLYKACVMVVRELLTEGRADFMRRSARKDAKQVYYMCMEFLMGRSLKNSLFSLGLEASFSAALKEFHTGLAQIYEQEPDAGLGNGGLGRLAACFLDGLATNEIPAMGYSIKYEFGIFRQKLVDGWQTELPDNWLPGGEAWLAAHPDAAVEVKFDGRILESWEGQYHHVNHIDATTVLAVPYDLMVPGQDGKGVSLLRLWSAKSTGFDMQLFNEGNYLRAMEQNAMAEVISKVLYPSDNHPEGKSLRLRQQYFLVSASVQDIFRRHLQRYGTLDNLPEEVAIHINDTHPALVVPELMRLLLDECGYTWEAAWDLVTQTVAYTNHTVMQEALECWSKDTFSQRLPRIWQIVCEIDNRQREAVWKATGDAGLVERTAIVSGGMVRMANLSVVGSHKVNGVSKLHSEILKTTVFSDFYALDPEKFTNVTNGIAQRRWLNQANPELAEFITDLIGNGYMKDGDKLLKLREFAGDAGVLSRLGEIKRHNKERLAAYVERQNGIALDPCSLFDVQAKRLHEYKRQHLNALRIVADYRRLKENPGLDLQPRTYLFAAKAAPGYFMAKQIIQMICEIGKKIDEDPAVRDRLRVVYLEDYRVTLAELLMPAAEISEQISLAGTEASGTGNMKLMLNGAITLGTEDGANVEIHEAVGDENIIIFGMSTPEASATRNGYNPYQIYAANPVLKDALDFIQSGLPTHFDGIFENLTLHDPYMVLADFDNYCLAQEGASVLYRNQETWNRMSLMNIAAAGRFSADRAIRQYASEIWNAKGLKG